MPHKLLLADDSVTIQRVIELTFADEDVQVVAVGDGAQAIARVGAERPDIVLADIGMPGRNGYEVASFIKGTPDLAHIPVLLLTGAFEPIDEGRARAVGCDGILVKPFEPQMVISRVKEFLTGKRRASALQPAHTPSSPPEPPPAPAEPALLASLDAHLAQRGAEPVATEATEPTSAPPVTPAGAVEDYFDRLDAAFASMEKGSAEPGAPVDTDTAGSPDQTDQTAEGPVSFALADELASWDPEIGTTRNDPDGMTVDAGLRPAEPPPTAQEPPAQPLPALAEAFAALLAAEQGRVAAPAAPVAPAPAVLSDELVEQVTLRVIERLADRSVRDIIVEVAERLVKEEIERIKAGAGIRN